MHRDINEYTGERDGDTGGFKQINLLDIIGNRSETGLISGRILFYITRENV